VRVAKPKPKPRAKASREPLSPRSVARPPKLAVRPTAASAARVAVRAGAQPVPAWGPPPGAGSRGRGGRGRVRGRSGARSSGRSASDEKRRQLRDALQKAAEETERPWSREQMPAAAGAESGETEAAHKAVLLVDGILTTPVASSAPSPGGVHNSSPWWGQDTVGLSLGEVAQAVALTFPEFDRFAALSWAYRAADAAGSGVRRRRDFRRLLARFAYFSTRWDRFEVIEQTVCNAGGQMPLDAYGAACSLAGHALGPEELAASFLGMATSKADGETVALEDFCIWCARRHAESGVAAGPGTRDIATAMVRLRVLTLIAPRTREPELGFECVCVRWRPRWRRSSRRPGAAPTPGTACRLTQTSNGIATEAAVVAGSLACASKLTWAMGHAGAMRRPVSSTPRAPRAPTMGGGWTTTLWMMPSLIS
jgi:hypothetical protein